MMISSVKPQKLSLHVGSLSSTDKTDITLEDARRYAMSTKPKWGELKHSPTGRTVTFKRKSERIVVYYATGTVITSSNLAKSYVRTNVDLVLLKQLFVDPRKDVVGAEAGAFSPLRCSKAIFDDNLPNERDAFEDILDEVDAELARLANMRGALEKRIEREKVREEEEIRKRRILERKLDIIHRRKMEDEERRNGKIKNRSKKRYVKVWGKDKLWWSPALDLNEFYKCIQKDMRQSVCLVTIPSGGILCAMEDGQTYWSTGGILDDEVERVLGTRGIKPRTIALGTKGRYYIAFGEGEEQWSGHEDFDKTVRESSVKCVAFGEDFDSYFVLHDNNICTWRNIPESLENHIRNNCKNGTVVDHISLGPKRGQYFVHFNNNVWFASGLSEEDKRALENLDGAIKEASFCKGGLVVRYTHVHDEHFIDTQKEQ